MYTRQELQRRLSDELAKLNTINANIQAIMDDLVELDIQERAATKAKADTKAFTDGLKSKINAKYEKKSWDGANPLTDV